MTHYVLPQKLRAVIWSIGSKRMSLKSCLSTRAVHSFFTKLFYLFLPLLYSVASAPTNLKAVQVGLSDIRLTWTPPSPLGDTTRYIITYTSHNTQSSSVTVSETVDLTNNTLLQLQTGENYTIELAGWSDHFSSKPVTTYIYVGKKRIAKLLC